ncbi:TIR domain-containing protein [bacterium AH-315-I18]|nr:TIR domain-containing protein [bacterium AH-315-I18]
MGNAIKPGIKGILTGGIAGAILHKAVADMVKTKIFVSFDFDNDRVLKEFIIGQSKLKDSPFEIVDLSLKEAVAEKDWPDKARRAISRSEMVIVLVGEKTYKAQGVLKEVKMARDLDKKIIQMIGYKTGDYTRVPDAGALYRWNWENLKKLLS